ncbi:dTDP-4-dehydrorhamnose 3,5-epimerase [Loktanella sp. DJP18]|uniref:dTDP-4-dehydrorhamnose 3,5-epimerase n=1 Tax=Loktanella sp. DJP18 TaxID=3409788 RepID=UPI003BB58297
MEFLPTSLPGVTIIRPKLMRDARGLFARTYCAEAFRKAGLDLTVEQMALSQNTLRGTLRGLHIIPEAVGEVKLVRCTRGAVFDVVVDLRFGSPAFGQWISVELNAKNYQALYLPKGLAHGFLTLVDDTEIAYQFSEPHRPGIETGLRWDDPDLAINWPFAPIVLSDRDRGLPLLAESEYAP